MSTDVRFQLFVKAGKDGKCFGDFPFSQKVYMFTKLLLIDSDVELVTINLSDKPKWFLDMNPEGTVPVLVDRQKDNKIVADSAEITRYLNGIFPKPELKQGYSGTGREAASDLFPKLLDMMKNNDSSKDDEFKANLVAVLKKINDFLSGRGDCVYMLADNVCELDCQVLPQLRHVQVAGAHYKNFNIPSEFTDLNNYIANGKTSDVFKSTCPPEEQIIWGWSKYCPKKTRHCSIV